MSENSVKTRGCEFALSEVWEKGGEGGIALAEKGIKGTGRRKRIISMSLYEDEMPLAG